jgi:hypothetical protein
MFVYMEYLQQQMLLAGMNHTVSGNFTGPLEAATVGLFTNNHVPVAGDTLPDYNLAVPASLAPQNATFGTPYRRPEGGICVQSAQLEYQLTGNDPITLAYGAVLLNAAGNVALGAELFPGGPIQLTDDLSAIIFSLQVAQGGPDEGNMILMQ